MNSTRLNYFFIGCLAVLVMCCGCGLDSLSGSKACAEQFMEKFKNRDYQGMYELLDDSAKAQRSLVNFSSFHKHALDVLGEINDYRKTSFFIELDQPKEGSLHGAVYDIDFAKAKGTYTLKILTKNGKNTIIKWTPASEKLI
jgi:hypothetical protein